MFAYWFGWGKTPFEGSPNDVPISNISRGITRDILQIIEEDPAKIPPAIENKKRCSVVTFRLLPS